MRKLMVFNFVSLDVYYADNEGSMSWAHEFTGDDEFRALATENARGSDAELLLGRITYDMMAEYWPSEQASAASPVTAEAMNRMKKHVLSRSTLNLSWNNARWMTDDIDAAVLKLKQEPGSDIMIFGSGSIISQIAPHGLISEYQLIVVPLVLGGGRNMFTGLSRPLGLQLTSHRVFGNGVVLLNYAAQI
jgi:dihydrofolate reductase